MPDIGGRAELILRQQENLVFFTYTVLWQVLKRANRGERRLNRKWTENRLKRWVKKRLVVLGRELNTRF
jgi:hypothetical protein